MTDAEKAYSIIKDRIITLAMPPGSAINLLKLTDDLGLGRTPIREALKQLQADSLVVVMQRRGMSVAEVALTDLRQFYEMRVALEPFCAGLAAERMSPANVEELRRLLHGLQQVNPDDRDASLAAERQLHALIAQSCGNRCLQTDTQHYFDLALRIWYLMLDRLPSAGMYVETHADLVEAIARHDAAEAQRLMRQHIDSFYHRARRAV